MKTIKCRFTDDTWSDPIPVDTLTFRPSVYGVIIKNQQVLLVPQRGGYGFPGGGIDLGESIDEALEREVKEETGMVVKRQDILLCESSFFVHPDTQQPFHCILAYYHCKLVGGELSTAGFNEQEKQYAQQAEWVDLARIKEITFMNSIDNLAMIKKALTYYD